MISRSRIRKAVLAALAITAVAVTVTQTAVARPAPRRAAKKWEIKMMTDMGPPRVQKFEPKELTIQVGDTVKWVAVSGSHNISFWADSIPTGAEAMIRKAMGADTVMAGGQGYATLTTTRKPMPGDSIVIVFNGFPKGEYKYNCRPHLMMGMIAKLIIQ